MTQNPKTARILIVEDDRLIIWCLVNSLKSAGSEITIVERGEKAIEKLSSTRFDLVITDMNLPDINGCEVASAVKQSAPDVPVILMSALEEQVQGDAARTKCFDYFIKKPFDLGEVAVLISKLLQPA